jgi:hypothetical protein
MGFVIAPIQHLGPGNFAEIGRHSIKKYGEYILGRHNQTNFVYLIPVSIAEKYELYDTHAIKIGLQDDTISRLHLYIKYTGSIGFNEKLIIEAFKKKAEGTDLINNKPLVFMPGNPPQKFKKTTIRLLVGHNSIFHLLIN